MVNFTDTSKLRVLYRRIGSCRDSRPIPVFVHCGCLKDQLREELLMEKELKTFSSDEGHDSSHLPTDVSSEWVGRWVEIGESFSDDMAKA